MSETTDEAAARSATRSPRHATAAVVVLSFFLLGTSAVLVSQTPRLDASTWSSAIWATPLLGVVFGITLLTVVRIEFRGNALLLSLSEIPLVFAAVFLAPIEGLGARLVASALIWTLVKRTPLHKLLFNLAMFSLEISFVYWIVRQIFDVDDAVGVRTVLVVTAAVTMAGIIGSVCVALAISRYEGNTIDHLVDELKSGWVLVVNAAMAGALLSVYVISPALAILSLVPVTALWFMMQRHGKIAQKLRDLNAVHGFAGRVGRSLELEEIGRAAVSEAASLLRADMCLLVLSDADGPARTYATESFPSEPVRRSSDAWAALVESSNATITDGTSLVDAGFDGWSECGGVIIASVDDEIGPIGVIIVARSHRSDTDFERDDAQRMQNLADQLASSLRKGMLHRRIQYEAAHDALTGLPNRLSLQRHLPNATTLAPAETQCYVMMMDLDRFKEVNDTLGHHAGDELLVEFARRMSEQLGPQGYFARLAGDEFAAVVYAADDEDALSIAQQCIAAGAAPLTLDGLSIVITASIGVALLHPGADDPELSLRHADVAMYNSKARHSGAELFRPEYNRRTPARLSMLGDLRSALDNDELDLEFQPKLDLASGLVIGAEALVRWNHRVRGVVSPNDFVRVAEDTGMIKQLTDRMLAQGIIEIRKLHERGHRLALSVNLSTHDLLDANLSSRVEGYLSQHDVDPALLTLEITESSLLVEAPRSRSTIQELHEMGVRLAIDDFGTGYSSLSYLRQLPVSELKVDQSFIATMLVDAQDEVIVRSTIDLGHNLGLEVVAEGVENEQILERLRLIGCDVAQGYTISRPLNPVRFLSWLSTSNHPSRKVDPTRPEVWALDEPL